MCIVNASVMGFQVYIVYASTFLISRLRACIRLITYTSFLHLSVCVVMHLCVYSVGSVMNANVPLLEQVFTLVNVYGVLTSVRRQQQQQAAAVVVVVVDSGGDGCGSSSINSLSNNKPIKSNTRSNNRMSLAATEIVITAAAAAAGVVTTMLFPLIFVFV